MSQDTTARYAREMANALVELRAWYAPRRSPWDDVDEKVRAGMIQTWIDAMADALVTTSQFRRALAVWRETPAGQYFPSLNDIMPLAKREKRKDAEASALPRQSQRVCSGDGWFIQPDGAVMPCPACNPALHAIYTDPSKMARWRDGTPLWDLDVGLERGPGKTSKYIGDAPVPCRSGDVFEQVVDIRTGLAICAKAYIEECERQGKVPDPKALEHWLGGRVVEAGS